MFSTTSTKTLNTKSTVNALTKAYLYALCGHLILIVEKKIVLAMYIFPVIAL